jgi:hypothetical protein
MPYRRLATAVLADWLEVEHTLRLVQGDTREAALLRVEAEGLQAEYQRLVDEARLFKRPLPPPFPACREPAPDDVRTVDVTGAQKPENG